MELFYIHAVLMSLWSVAAITSKHNSTKNVNSQRLTNNHLAAKLKLRSSQIIAEPAHATGFQWFANSAGDHDNGAVFDEP